mmetsp:Transcript_118494/g.330588  ORF Transcript_118494/g.330588 Transcript_118494/m.330588 type:complete len:336 (+) Transcript_118494:932-1939(+)
MPSSSACSIACFRTKFCSGGSSASAAILIARSKRFIWLMNRSRKTPEQLQTTSMRGRPSSSSGMSSTLLTRPRLSAIGLAPTSAKTCARLSPYVLMLSVPQRVNAMDSGSSSVSPMRSSSLSTTTSAVSAAAFVGMDCGSKACMFLPVGNTSGLRMGSPPGPGSMNSPLSARKRLGNSLLRTTSPRQTCKYSKSGDNAPSSQSGKPAPARACFQGLPPVKKFMTFLMNGFTSSTRPSELVDSATKARTAALLASVTLWMRVTSSSTPLSELRYRTSMSRPTDSAMILGKLFTPISGRSSWAMFTSVATLSSAVGGTPTRWRPAVRDRDSISMSLR